MTSARKGGMLVRPYQRCGRVRVTRETIERYLSDEYVPRVCGGFEYLLGAGKSYHRCH